MSKKKKKTLDKKKIMALETVRAKSHVEMLKNLYQKNIEAKK